MITDSVKTKILAALRQSRRNFAGSDARYAISLGINAAQYSRIKNGDTEKVLSDAMWMSIARKLNVSIGHLDDIITVETPAFVYLTTQFQICQQNSSGMIFCDVAGVGKTHAAVFYAKNNRNVIYIDCSQVKTKQRLIRFLAKELGVNHTGKYWDVYDELCFYLCSIPKPFLIFDEAGDLKYEAFMEVKSLCNKVKGMCGWAMIGANGLQAKLESGINNRKLGYEEMFDRFGGRVQRITPENKKERDQFMDEQIALIVKANAPNKDIRRIIATANHSTRRVVDIELRK